MQCTERRLQWLCRPLTVVRRAGAAGWPRPAAPPCRRHCGSTSQNSRCTTATARPLALRAAPHCRPRQGRAGFAALVEGYASPKVPYHRTGSIARALGGRPPGGDPTRAQPAPPPARVPSAAAPRDPPLAGAGLPKSGAPPPEGGGGGEPGGQLGKQLGVVLLAAAAAVVATLTVRSGASPAALVAKLEALVDASGPAGPAVFVGAYAVGTTLFFPAALLTLGAGCAPGHCFPACATKSPPSPWRSHNVQ